MVTAVYRINWTEMERGWGQKDFGHTDYETLEEAEQAIKDHWDSQPDGPAPDWYIRPDKPFLVEKKDD